MSALIFDKMAVRPGCVAFCLLLTVVLTCPPAAQPQTNAISQQEFQQRRSAMLQKIPNGVLLLHARSLFSGDDELYTHAFQQNPSFLYFTGLNSLLSAILALDGTTGESWLFVPTKLRGLAGGFKQALLSPGIDSEETFLLDHVVPWDDFRSFMEDRLTEHSNLIAYTDDSHWSPSPESNPPGFLAVADPYVLWPQALHEAWPGLRIESGKTMIATLRLVKSPAEIAAIRKVARVSADALRAGLRSLRAGKTQRQVEADIVSACIEAGGEGPSFWPWVMSGPNAVLPKPLESFVDYHHLNRVMQAGDLVRVDVGCDADFYKGDVGRTAPASGKFDADQKETWELLVSAYQTAVASMRPGLTHAQIEETCRQTVARRQESLTRDLARKAAEKILAGSDDVLWHLHGSGLEPGEGRPDTLRTGMVIEFEPMFSVEGQAFYLEDMILITESGHEILTSGLPYSADELERIIGQDE